MNNTYNFLKSTIAVVMLIGFTSCIHDDIVDYKAQDTATLEKYLDDNDIQYRKTSTLPNNSGSVYITPPNSGGMEIPKPDDARIIEMTLDLRRFAQEHIGDPLYDKNPDDLVTTVFLKDSTYTFAMRRGAICLGTTDAVINTANYNEIHDRVYIPSYLAFGGTSSSSLGLQFNDIVTLENMRVKAVRGAMSQAMHEGEVAKLYAKDSLGLDVLENDSLYNNTSIVEEESDDNPALELRDYIVKVTETENQSGDLVAAGDTVMVRYEGKFIDQDGRVFDSNTGSDDAALQVIVYEDLKAAQEGNAMSTVINGWYKALRTMRIGEKAIFVMPSHTAYWETGDNPNTSDLFKTIRPFKTLVFTIEIKEEDQK